MRIAVTGHQPPQLGGYAPDVFDALCRLAQEWLRAQPASEVISGMAAGWDLAMAEAARREGIPLVAAMAFPEQGRNWPDPAVAQLRGLLDYAAVVQVMFPRRQPEMWTLRDQWVLDRGEQVVALWSGTPGGTGNAVAYAQRQGKLVTNLWSRWHALAPSGVPDPLQPSVQA